MTLPLFAHWLAPPSAHDDSSERGFTRKLAASSIRVSALPVEEHHLIARVRASDPHALETIFRTYAPRLLAFAAQMLHAQDAAEDVLQDVFLGIWRNREVWQVHTSLATYLFQAVRHRAAARNQQRAGESPQRYAMGLDITPLVSPVPCPDIHAEDAELQAAVQQAIQRLTPVTREVFILSRDYGLTYRDIAALRGISIKTVEMHIGRALATLRAVLAPWIR